MLALIHWTAGQALGKLLSSGLRGTLIKDQQSSRHKPASKPNQINKVSLSKISVFEQNGCQKRVWMNRLISEGIASKGAGTEYEREQLISMGSLCKHPARALSSPVRALLEGTGWETARHRANHLNALGITQCGDPG